MRSSRSDAFPLTLSPPAAADVDRRISSESVSALASPTPPTIADPTAPTANGATPTPTNDDAPVFRPTAASAVARHAFAPNPSPNAFTPFLHASPPATPPP